MSLANATDDELVAEMLRRREAAATRLREMPDALRPELTEFGTSCGDSYMIRKIPDPALDAVELSLRPRVRCFRRRIVVVEDWTEVK